MTFDNRVSCGVMVFGGLLTTLLGSVGSADARISAQVLGTPLMITASDRTAGAISSLTWNGKEFINADDHGRELQSASSFDGLGECYNPTEAGSAPDGAGAISTSRLRGISAVGNVLRTTTQMAFWTKAGQAYPNGCGGNPNLRVAQNSTDLSNHTLSKAVTIGFNGLSNVIQYLVSFQVPEHHGAGTFEALTGYLAVDFSSFWTFDPASSQLAPLSAGPGEQALPLILATADQAYAMGVYAPEAPPSVTGGVGYGRFAFAASNTMKWNAVFRTTDTPAGTYSFQMYVVVGNLAQVQQGLAAVYAVFHPRTPPVIPPAPPAVASPIANVPMYRHVAPEGTLGLVTP